jgi:hypothetical protein
VRRQSAHNCGFLLEEAVMANRDKQRKEPKKPKQPKKPKI